MADNVVLPATGTGTADVPVATDKVTYSGDASQNVQLMRSVLVTGAEGSKTVVDPDMNSGSKSAATLRVVIATDQPALTNKLLVTPDSVALPANQSCNMAQVAGTATSVNSGNKDAGTQRVVIATDQVALTNPLLITGSGTAGTAASGVQTVQGIASMTPVQVSQATAATLNCTEASAAAIKTAVEIIDNPVLVDDAAFTVASSSLMMSGNQAVSHGTNPDSADALDAVVGIANRHRVPFVMGGHPNIVSYGMSLTTAVSNTVIGPTIATGTILIVTSISFILDNASTVFPTVVIGFGTANTPAFATTPGTAKIIAGHPACPAGGGITKGDGSGIIGIGADDEELRITTTGNAGGAGIYVLMTGYTIAT